MTSAIFVGVPDLVLVWPGLFDRPPVPVGNDDFGIGLGGSAAESVGQRNRCLPASLANMAAPRIADCRM